MKKTLGVVAAAVAAVTPMASVLAAGTSLDPLTDTLEITIENACTFEYNTDGHSDGTNGKWTDNTLKATMLNGDEDLALGTTEFIISCNDDGGYSVAFTAEDLTGATHAANKISFTGNAPSNTSSSWGIKVGSNWKTAGTVIDYSADAVSEHTFSVTYGAAIDATQEADVYSGDATYTLTYPDQSN